MIELDFNKHPDRIIPAIAQDYQSGKVLMLAYVNEDSLKLSIKTNYATYWSRSRNKLWKKGESSGNLQQIKEILVDCDLDAVIFRVEQIGGKACHTGKRSCFFRRIKGNELEIIEPE